ncbi:DUF4136 domain-containing protein [Zobellia alginiliquefaciens]|uniref:DUF4136 domain-containing protein n=1 Tax=Zobellia alginiliquefaciens TaxID=3032586 RepID=UPI0023E1A870|nr:DUF4136 domain-containing protein [Zobellia alginiliquefaciens]
MKKTTYNIILICTLVFFWSCGPKIAATTKTQKNLKNYETYAYLPNTGIEAPQGITQSADVGSEIVEAVNKNMTRAGYTVDRENPDLLVLLKTNYDKETETYMDPDYAFYPYASSYPISPYYNNYYYYRYNTYNNIVDYDKVVDRYIDAGLVINLVDRESKNIVWTGTADDFEIYQQDVTAKVAAYVDDVFDKYPTVANN